MEPQIIDYYQQSKDNSKKKYVPKEYYIKTYGIRTLHFAQLGYENFHNLQEGTSTYEMICNSSAGVWEWSRMGRQLEQPVTV